MQIPSRYQINTSSFAHYWTKGIGAELLKKLHKQPDLSESKAYIPYLYAYDEDADKLVQEIHQQVGFPAGQKIVHTYMTDPESVEERFQVALQTFFSTLELSPAWLDAELVQKGVQLSQRSGLSGLIVLRDYCLMGGYESAAINKPLIFTGALKKGAAKRLTETVDFWVEITADHALERENNGFRKIIETRMIHAYSRINILEKTDWKSEDWGIPLNHWDMLATNLGFSFVFMVGLQKLKFQLLQEEIEGVLHLWKYIGTLLGIPLHILPNNEQEAIEALYFWTMTQKDGDDDSKLLAHALQQEPIKAFYPKTHLGRKMMREIHLYYNHYLLGSYSTQLLMLDKTIIGSFAYLQILKNKVENSKINIPIERQRLIEKGRKKHLEVQQIYLTHNNKIHHQH